MESVAANTYKAVVIGASGAAGRQIVAELCASPKWSEVAIIARNELPQWATMPGKEKLRLHKVDSLDVLEDKSRWNF